MVLRRFHRARIISISNDSRQDHGYHLQIAWLRWTSSRRSISLYPSKKRRCSQINESSKGTTQFEEKVKEIFLENQKGFHLHHRETHLLDAGEAINDLWSMSGNFKDRHHGEPRVKLCSPREREESFPIPLKYIDVSRTRHTNSDVKQERRINDYWNIDGTRDLSDPRTGFTQFTLLEEKLPAGYMWSGVRLTRKQLTSRPDHLWPEIWKSMGKHAKLKEKQKWSNEKLHLENARKLRGIYFIDPEDKEIKETIKNARKKLETSVAPAMPCKILKNCGSDGSKKNKTRTCVYSGRLIADSS